MNIHSPPSLTYKFPASAFHAQKVTAALLIENTRAYCLNDLGTGKTRSCCSRSTRSRGLGRRPRCW